MKIKAVKRLLLAVILITALAFCFTGCGEEETKNFISIPESLSLKVEEKYMIEPEITGEIAGELTWESSDNSVAEVSKGLVFAKKIGNCEITVSAGEISAKCKVTVTASENKPTLITGIRNDEVGVSVGASYKINAYMLYDGKQIASGITYSSKNTDIATVSASGEITGVSYGKTSVVITGEYSGSTTSAVISVNVFDSGLSFGLKNGQENLCIINNSFAEYPTEKELEIQVFGSEEEITDTLDFTWEVKETVEGNVTVNIIPNGAKAKITANNVGVCDVKVSFKFLDHDYTAYCNVTVNKTEIENEKYLAEKDGNGNAIIVLPEEFGVDTVQKVLINGETAEYVKGESNSVVVAMENGQKIEIISELMEFSGNVFIVDKVFKQADVADFASIIEENLNGYYVLGEDLDFTGVTFKSIGGLENSSDTVKAFAGTFDGNGFAIKNLTITARTVKDQYGVYKTGAGNVFANNCGTITNLFVKMTAPNVNNYVGFIGENGGNVNNILVDITLTGNMTDGTSQANGSVVCRNNSNGTVKSCIAIVNGSGLAGNQKFGLIAGVNYSGASYPVNNNYAVSNGLTVAYGTGGQDVLYGLSYPEDTRKSKDCAVFTNVATLANTVVFDRENGWNELWSVEKDTLKFNNVVYAEKYLGKFVYDIVADKNKAGFTQDFSEVMSDDIVSATVNGVDSEIFSGKTVAISYETLKALPVGVFLVELRTATAVYKAEVDRLTAQITLMQKDAENLQAIIESDLSGEYILGEDIDMTGITFKSIGGLNGTSDSVKEFKGTFDGNGYAIKNLTVTARTVKDQYGVYKTGAGNVFATNGGTIKNLYVQMTAPNVNNFVGFIGQNFGTVSNVFVDITLTGNMTDGYSQANGSVACRNDTKGTVKNCIVNINASGLAGSQKYGTAVGMNYSGDDYPIANCYAITNGLTLAYGTGGRDVLYGLSYDADTRKPRYSANYENATAFFGAISELQSLSGWSELWSIKEDGLYFGANKVLNK